MANTILITGGTGLIGKALTESLLQKGHKVVILTRNKNMQSTNPNISYKHWDLKNKTMAPDALEQVDAIVHLAGAGVVDRRWTDTYKQEILSSRTESSALLMQALANQKHQVKTFVSTSAIGWYGPDLANGKAFTETDESNSDYLGTTCELWEESVLPCKEMGIRLCIIRTGIVLSKDGGALREFIKPLKMGVAAILSTGNQMISWIHIRDLCNLYIRAIEQESMEGIYNGVAPHPVSNKELTLTLAKMVRKGFFVPVHVPAMVLKVMLGESSIEVLKSTTVSSKKTESTGFVYIYPTINSALQNLTNPA
jgi:uncharacterized protein (TIGR01777 family)